MGLSLEVVRPDLGQRVPDSLGGFGGLALGGGPQGAYETAKIPLSLQRMRVGPLCGVSGQAGDRIVPGRSTDGVSAWRQSSTRSAREVGFFEVTLDPISQYDPLWRGIPAKFVATHWHGDVFDIPPGGMRLASSALTRNQLFRYGHALYGLQFHLEMTPGCSKRRSRERIACSSNPASMRT